MADRIQDHHWPIGPMERHTAALDAFCETYEPTAAHDPCIPWSKENMPPQGAVVIDAENRVGHVWCVSPGDGLVGVAYRAVLRYHSADTLIDGMALARLRKATDRILGASPDAERLRVAADHALALDDRLVWAVLDLALSLLPQRAQDRAQLLHDQPRNKTTP